MDNKRKNELIEKWNENASKLPELKSTDEYTCKKCGHKFTLRESDGDIDAWGIEIICPKCDNLVAFEPLGYSKYE